MLGLNTDLAMSPWSHAESFSGTWARSWAVLEAIVDMAMGSWVSLGCLSGVRAPEPCRRPALMSSLERVGEVESVAEMITESVAESIVKVSLSRNARLTVSTRGPWARRR